MAAINDDFQCSTTTYKLGTSAPSSELISLQGNRTLFCRKKYLREDDHSYGSFLNGNIEIKFAELCAQEYAKENNKQQATGGRKGNINKKGNTNAGWKGENNNNNLRNKQSGAGAALPRGIKTLDFRTVPPVYIDCDYPPPNRDYRNHRLRVVGAPLWSSCNRTRSTPR